MKIKLLILSLLICTNAFAASPCDENKTVNGVDICIINIPLEIKQSTIDAGAINLFAVGSGYTQKIQNPAYDDRAEIPDPENEGQVIPNPTRDSRWEIDNPVSMLDHSKSVIKQMVANIFSEFYVNNEISKAAEKARIEASDLVKV